MTPRPCKVEGCPRPERIQHGKKKGFCSTHLRRKVRTGSVDGGKCRGCGKIYIRGDSCTQRCVRCVPLSFRVCLVCTGSFLPPGSGHKVCEECNLQKLSKCRECHKIFTHELVKRRAIICSWCKRT